MSNKDYRVAPPPRDSGPEPLFRIVYVIDVNASNARKAAEYLADSGRKLFTGPMNGGLWNGRCLDACIMSKKQNDKVAYEFLLKFGNLYARDLSKKQKQLWEKTKDTAAAMLKPAKSCNAAKAKTSRHNQ